MAELEERARSVFFAALEQAPGQWPDFLAEACGDDAELRQRVDQLLSAHQGMGSIDGQEGGVNPTVPFVPSAEAASPLIGPYKLLQKIGEGGFGLVYMAEQEHPVRRMVAIKIIKPGMDTAHVIARFESERQALALMEHPNVAQVLDAGATETGHPYFVMELVKGVPITEFCDKNHLRPEARLKLFVDVCHAIQHAHHKGVIHRDIKPSNVMVTLHDGVPVVKVIDFGVAKATVQKLTERTLFTAYGQMVGTPAYMSPEQAEMSGLDIDTRSDVYSLGVLLYELLTGTTPLETKRLRSAAYAEIQRMIREEEAPRPSTRLSSLKDSATILAGNRGLDVKRLRKLLAGDLDWIVMKALEKDRNRRYVTPGNLAEDVQRYLNRDPILARPPSAIYKLKRFAQRNRGAVFTISTIATALVIGSILATWQAVRATRAETKALDAESQALRDRAAAETQRQIAERNEAEARASEGKARAAETAAKESDATATSVLSFVRKHIFAAPRPPQLGQGVTLRKALDAAEPQIVAAFATRPRVEAQLREMLGNTYLSLDERQLGEVQLERAYALAKEHYGIDDPFTLDIEASIQKNNFAKGRGAQTVQILEQALARRRKTLGPQHPTTIWTLSNLAAAYENSGHIEDAKKVSAELLKIHLEQGLSPGDIRQARGIAQAYRRAGRLDEAARVIEQGLPAIIAKLGPDDEQVIRLTEIQAMLYADVGRAPDAVAVLTLVYQRALHSLGATHPQTLSVMQNLTAWNVELGRSDDAIRILEAAIPVIRREYGPAHTELAPHVINLVAAYGSRGRHRDGVRVIEETIAAIPEKERVAYLNLDFLLRALAGCYFALGDRTGGHRAQGDCERYIRARFPADSLELSTYLASLGKDLLDTYSFADAERLLRESYNIRKAKEPKGRRVVTVQVLLGEALVDEERFADAEPLLTAACQQLKKTWQQLPRPAREALFRAEQKLVIVYQRAGRRDDAIQLCRESLERWEKQNPSDPEALYLAAFGHAVAATALKSGKGANAGKLTTAESDQAVRSLSRAVALGFNDKERLKQEHAFDAIRDRDDFKKLFSGDQAQR